jgi:lysine-specific demethylase 3
LGLDFLSPESLGVSARLAEEIRCLPNDHEAKLQVLEVRLWNLSSITFNAFFSLKFFHYFFFLFFCNPATNSLVLLSVNFLIFYWVFIQVGKMSLYAASSAIKEVQKLVLDPK